jgi:hypothetical protein
VARIASADAQAWVDRGRLRIDDSFLGNDTILLTQVESTIISRLSGFFNTATWVDSASTPQLVRTIISMTYVAAVYRRQLSEITAPTGFRTYPDWLEQNALLLMQGAIDGTYDIGVVPTGPGGQPAFYPTDESSALEPTSVDPSLGDAHFSMGTVF